MTTSFDFACDVTQTVERLLSTPKRERTLEYIRDMRNLLGVYPAREGTHEQAYRDRWSHLCRQLCDERGHPQLTGIDGGKVAWPVRMAPFDGCA